MRILYISQYFPPEMGAPSARVSELARHWVREGHEVTVLTGFPNHPTGQLHQDYRGKLKRGTLRERTGGVDVVRTWLWPTPNRKSRERMLNYASFALSGALRGMTLPRPDVVIATSPQMLVGMTGWWLAKLKRSPFVFEVRDLWPESLYASGVASERSPLIRALDRMADFLYRSADRVVTVTEAQRRDLIERRGLPAGKVKVAENGVETDLFAPMGMAACREELGLPADRFIVSYIGTLGMAHGLNLVLDAAARLERELPRALFLLVGEGASKEALERQAQERGLTNVRFLPQQPRERVPAAVNASDACLVTLREAQVFRTVIPSKMLEFMACGRPIVLQVDGQARAILEEA